MPRTASVARRLLAASDVLSTIGYAVLSFGGWLGLGDKLFAVPWETLILDGQRNAFLFPVSADALRRAPGFEKAHWPDELHPDWEDVVRAHYGAKRH